jgi:polar amino acid transport system substrate-binding protein
VVAFAGGRQRLASGTQNVRGLRLLDDNFYGVPQTIAVQLDRTDGLQLVNAALDELRANGFLADPDIANVSFAYLVMLFVSTLLPASNV